jgi:hypothetical protein
MSDVIKLNQRSRTSRLSGTPNVIILLAHRAEPPLFLWNNNRSNRNAIEEGKPSIQAPP